MRDSRRRFDRLANQFFDDLYRFARRLERDDASAEDLLQQALVTGFQRLDQLHDDGAYKVWQSRILLRTWQNRHRRRTPDEEPADNVVVLHGPHDTLERARLGDALFTAIEGLPDAQREAVVLVDVMGMGFSEAAEVLGVPWGTAASRVARARSALRSVLEGVAREQGVIR